MAGRSKAIGIGLAAVILGLPTGTLAHSGGTNAQGCHTNRSTGDYHCHNGRARPQPNSQPRPRAEVGSSGSRVPFANCTAARAAGAAPVRRGDPGYGPHLDRDNDGIGCER